MFDVFHVAHFNIVHLLLRQNGLDIARFYQVYHFFTNRRMNLIPSWTNVLTRASYNFIIMKNNGFLNFFFWHIIFLFILFSKILVLTLLLLVYDNLSSWQLDNRCGLLLVLVIRLLKLLIWLAIDLCLGYLLLRLIRLHFYIFNLLCGLLRGCWLWHISMFVCF